MKCPECATENAEFYERGRLCKKCVRVRSKKRYWANREAILREQRARLRAKPGYVANANLKQNYGISLEEYTDWCSLQGNKCAICRLPAEHAPKQKLYVDHCHTTGLVRGMLCAHCNSLLGYAKDRIETLLEAASYLKMREAA